LALGTNEADISKFLAEMHAARFQEVRDQQYADDKKAL